MAIELSKKITKWGGGTISDILGNILIKTQNGKLDWTWNHNVDDRFSCWSTYFSGSSGKIVLYPIDRIIRIIVDDFMVTLIKGSSTDFEDRFDEIQSAIFEKKLQSKFFKISE